MRMKFVRIAPQAMAPNMHTPVRRVREKSISTILIAIRIRPFSPKRVMTFIIGVSMLPRDSAMLCIRRRIKRS